MSDDRPASKASSDNAISVTLFPSWFLFTCLVLVLIYSDEFKTWLIEVKTASIACECASP